MSLRQAKETEHPASELFPLHFAGFFLGGKQIVSWHDLALVLKAFDEHLQIRRKIPGEVESHCPFGRRWLWRKGRRLRLGEPLCGNADYPDHQGAASRSELYRRGRRRVYR